MEERSMKKKAANRFYLILILGLALFLRIYRLPNLELFGDELDVGYHAYSLWASGRDYLGQRFPFYIHSFSEWRAPLLMYLAAPFVGFLGLNEWGVRLPAVLLGVLNIYLFYLLIKEVFKDEKLALWASLLMAIIPWHLHYSRTAFESTLLLGLVLLGTLAFIRKKWWLAVMGFALSFYSYNTANIFVPLWVMVLFLVFRSKKNLFWIAGKVSLLALLLLPLALCILKGRGSARFKLISIFNNPQTIDQIVFKRNTGIENQLIERGFHNKLTGWGKEFIDNYLTAFSPNFLFINGDPNPRHNPPSSGQLYWFLALFLIFGLIKLVQEKERFPKQFTLAWLLIAPLASSLTIAGGNQATRLFLMIPPLLLLVALGIKSLIDNKVKIILILGFLAAGLFFWLHDYFVHYPKEQYRFWHYGYKEAMQWLKDEEDSFEKIIINNNHEPALIRYLFWTKKDPYWFRDNFQGDEEDFVLGKVNFRRAKIGEDWQDKTLYLVFQGDDVPGDWDWSKEPPAGVRVLKTVYDPWQMPMMYWVTQKYD